MVIGQAGQWTRIPSTTPLQPLSLNADSMPDYRKLVNDQFQAEYDGLKPHLPPLSSQKNKMIIFGLHSTYGDWPGWSMDSNPIHHPSPAKKIKCSFLDYIQLLMIGRAGRWTRIPSATPLHPKK